MKVNIAFTIEPEQLALLRQFAKDEGRSTSDALRRMIEEWRRMKTDALHPTQEGNR